MSQSAILPHPGFQTRTMDRPPTHRHPCILSLLILWPPSDHHTDLLLLACLWQGSRSGSRPGAVQANSLRRDDQVIHDGDASARTKSVTL